jgi:aspartyl-tRNA synthetase
MRTLVDSAVQKSGEKITVSGWVQTRRDHGGLVFIDLRDHTGILQLVIHPDTAEAFKTAGELRDEYVITAAGTVKDRDTGLMNNNLPTGKIELVVETIEVLNKAETLPIQPFIEAQANEELRLKYRYLDLRRPKMQHMLKQRAVMYKTIRDYMEDLDFIEVATPILANSSPEGARDFLIPSRLHEGNFYALPQAPQQFKQLLMVGGIPRYYQLAACFRDEDPRSDRLYGEFYQLDLEMSFVDDGEEVRTTMDPLVKQLVTRFAGKKLLADDVPRISYADSMNRFGTDKPDLRFGMELTELSEVFQDSEFGVFKNAVNSGGVIKAIRVEGGASLSRKQIDGYTEVAKQEGAGGLAYLIYEEGIVRSPIAKFMNGQELDSVRKIIGAVDGDIVFFGADKKAVVNKVLGRLRSILGDDMKLKDSNIVALAWIVDFPFYERNETAKKLDFGHNPFSMPKNGLADFGDPLDEEKLESILADQYDMVMNGYEICSGGVRNHSPEIMYQVFAAIGYAQQYVDERFGAMINAFKYGAPPHAGCAFGVDRILMELMGESNVREVVAFPKNGSGMDVMMNSPSVADPTLLKELGL